MCGLRGVVVLCRSGAAGLALNLPAATAACLTSLTAGNLTSVNALACASRPCTRTRTASWLQRACASASRQDSISTAMSNTRDRPFQKASGWRSIRGGLLPVQKVAGWGAEGRRQIRPHLPGVSRVRQEPLCARRRRPRRAAAWCWPAWSQRPGGVGRPACAWRRPHCRRAGDR